jgi:hypothetical protein
VPGEAFFHGKNYARTTKSLPSEWPFTEQPNPNNTRHGNPFPLIQRRTGELERGGGGGGGDDKDRFCKR